ncbi:hypothetical protein OPV22_000651 [Ensete ventricosum]|uniref:Uncharacterized protein n=1 Tax=Ensete ventricosum TaxID=4639 RepID=A0AAV8RVK3_ENSVE|nr:hypothetical protein OPV22_000651 [Ensete ventricosum]
MWANVERLPCSLAATLNPIRKTCTGRVICVCYSATWFELRRCGTERECSSASPSCSLCLQQLFADVSLKLRGTQSANSMSPPPTSILAFKTTPSPSSPFSPIPPETGPSPPAGRSRANLEAPASLRSHATGDTSRSLLRRLRFSSIVAAALRFPSVLWWLRFPL